MLFHATLLISRPEPEGFAAVDADGHSHTTTPLRQNTAIGCHAYASLRCASLRHFITAIFILTATIYTLTHYADAPRALPAYATCYAEILIDTPPLLHYAAIHIADAAATPLPYS